MHTIKLPDGTVVTGDKVIVKSLSDGTVTITLPKGKVDPPIVEPQGRIIPSVDPHASPDSTG
jgi:hypothetical protein